VADAANVSWPDPVHSGSHALRVTESPEGGTPQAWLAFLEFLSDGDIIEACFWGYDRSPGTAPSLRIWAHYAESGEVGFHRGTASGNTKYTEGDGWDRMCHRWIFDSAGRTRDAFVVEARLYSPEGSEPDFYIDDLEVEVSSKTARITLACRARADEGQESTWGSVKALYR
jgi:hypothetical protein